MRARRGVVLPIVLLALLILEILAAGTLALAHLEHSLARERMNALRAQVAARSAASELAGRWNETRYQTMAPGTATQVLSGALDTLTRYTTTLERLSPTLFLVQGNGAGGNVTAGEARATAGLLIAVHDISAMAAQFPAAFTAVGGAQLTGNAIIDADQAALLPLGWSAASCASWLGLPLALPALLVADATTVSAASSAFVVGQPPLLAQPTLTQMPFDQLGPLDLTMLHALAERVESGALQLAPVAVSGVCTTNAPANWGAPLDQAHPCNDYFPLIFAPGDLTIAAGAGQGVLVVAGDLTLAPGAQFFGVVLVLGRIIAGSNAEITGAAQAGSASPSLLNGASIVRNNCAVYRALSQGIALNRAVRRMPRQWIPVY